jgi:hypothetical protein
MAVLLNQTMPEGVDVSMLDEVAAEMGVEKDPPAGLVVHVHFMENGRARVIDVWESQQQYDKFNQDRLGPAIQAVLERRGVTMKGQPDASFTEVAGMIRGS